MASPISAAEKTFLCYHFKTPKEVGSYLQCHREKEALNQAPKQKFPSSAAVV
jgi:hypothetical protein